MDIRRYYKFIILIFAFLILLSLLNIKVITRQAINYRLQNYKIPLFFKIIDFYSRHYHYKLLARRITEDCVDDKEKVMKIFYWTHDNIRRDIPANFPIIDDHALNVIIRGYGTHDQSAEVFTTLCVYAGIPALWMFIHPDGSKARLAISLVKLNGKWRVFDSYHANFFLNKKNEIASIEDILAEPEIVQDSKHSPEYFYSKKYSHYFDSLKAIDGPIASDAYLEMPGRRIIHEFKKLLHIY